MAAVFESSCERLWCAPDKASNVRLRANTLGATVAVLGGLCAVLFLVGVMFFLDNADKIDPQIVLSMQTLGLLLLVFWSLSAVSSMLVIHYTILSPVAHLRMAVAETGKQRDLSKRIELSFPGEVEALATTINAMLLALQRTVEADRAVTQQAGEELKRAKERAEQASRAKSQFLAAISYEIRSQLHGILGITHLAREDALPSETREQFAMAQASAASLVSLVNDVLDYSKIEAGTLEFENINFDLVSALNETLKPLERRAETKGLVFQVKLCNRSAKSCTWRSAPPRSNCHQSREQRH